MSTAATALAASSMSTTEPQLENRVLTPFRAKQRRYQRRRYQRDRVRGRVATRMPVH
jgi:hypothetical protein